jgi:hypothetical protein
MTYGPVEYLVIEFKGSQFNGEVLPALVELVEKQIIHIIDLVLITKDRAGQVTPLELHHLTPEQARMFEPLNAEISALLSMSDIEEAGAAMENDSTAGLILFEHLWPKEFDEAVARANGAVLFSQLIPSDVVAENLEAMAAVSE